MSGESWLVAVDSAGQRTTLLVEPDERRQRRALVHARGFALSHLESAIPGPIRDAVLALDDGPPSIDALCARLSAPDRRVLIVRRLLPTQRVPAWPVAIRRGTPAPLWPFDAELAGLRIGARRLVRREGLDAAEAARERTYFEGHGFSVRWLGAPHGTLVVAADRSVLEEAAAREAANVASNDSFQDAARWVGRALGYPECCVESFVRIRRRDEKLLLAEHLPPIEHAPAPPETLWLNGALSLISHAPCSLECAPSRSLAVRLREELDRASPAFAGAWRSLAQRVHAINANGAVLAIDLEGPLDGGRIRHALEIAIPTGGSLELTRERHDLVGAVTSIREHQWVSEGFGATLVADHRGNRANPSVPDDSGLASSATPS